MEEITVKTDHIKMLYNKANGDVKQELDAIFGKEIFKEDPLPTSVPDALQRIGATDEEKEFLLKSTNSPLIKWLQAVGSKAVICQAANKSVPMNWNDHNKAKYRGWYNMGKRGTGPGVGFSFGVCGYGRDGSTVASRLCLHESEHVEKLYNRFPDIEKAVMLG